MSLKHLFVVLRETVEQVELVQELEATVILKRQGPERGVEVLLKLLHDLWPVLLSQRVKLGVGDLESLSLELFAEDLRVDVGHRVFCYYGVDLVKSIGFHDLWPQVVDYKEC